jgi:hypothetical protein
MPSIASSGEVSKWVAWYVLFLRMQAVGRGDFVNLEQG